MEESSQALRRTFDQREVEEVRSAFRVAEDLAGDHFALPALDTWHHPVDLATLVDLHPGEVVPEGVLAQVARYDERLPLVRRARTLYRVCLQDHAILARLAEERGAVGFFPLLVYVLTHELVHVVRFVQHEGAYVATERTRALEEATVHRLTRRILQRAPVRGLGPVLERFRPFAELAAQQDA